MSDDESLRYDAEMDDRVHWAHVDGVCGGPTECAICEYQDEMDKVRFEEEAYWDAHPEQLTALNDRLRAIAARFNAID